MKFVLALCSSVSLITLASPAFAQSGADVASAQAPAAIDEVVVTGSRIVRDGYEAPTPVTVAPVAQLEKLAPTSIADGLNKLPVFNGSTSASTFANGTNVGGSYLNLRSFGINRTLVLMDGLRVPPSNFNGQVDTNSIPQQLVQRVDVVTGGASAVYGSDAITGVVNFVLDTQFTGLKGMVQGGISGQDDAGSFRAGLAWGADVSDRGHLIASYEHFQQGGLTHEDRSYGSERPVYTGGGTAANPYVLTDFAHESNTAFGGLATSGPFKGQQFGSNGALAPFNPGTPTGLNNVATGGDGAYANQAPLFAPQQSDQLFARFQYDLSDKITGYIQGADTLSQNKIRASNSPADNLTIFSGNPYLPASAQAALTGTGTLANPQFSSFTMSRLDRDLNLDSEQTQKSGGLDITVGLSGSVFNDFKWNANYTHGRSDFRQQLTNNISSANFLAAVDAVTGPDGSTVCRVTLTNPGLYPGCAPIDLFGVNNESAAAKAFIYQTTSFEIVNALDDYVASISGTPINDWAGPVSMALSAEYRTQSMKETSSASPLAVPSYTGIRAGSTPKSVYIYNTVAPASGSDSVKEASAELVVPLLANAPFAQALDVNGAARYTDYSSSGAVNTWKVGLDYRPNSEFRIRATESKDIRAPTLFDLYAGQSSVVQAFNDTHTNTGGTVTILSTGNPNLVPEVSKTFTAGVVYSPSWLSSFRISVDYYDISIKNAITQLQGNQATTLQECEASGGTSAICQLIQRPLPFSNTTSSNYPTLVLTESLNIAQVHTQGVDVEASYHMDLDSISTIPAALNLRLLYNYQPVLDTQSYPGSIVAHTAGTVGVAANRATIMAGYELGGFSFEWTTRYSGSEARSTNPALIFADPRLPAILYTDVNAAYRFIRSGRDLELFLNVGNLFNQQPRIASNITVSGTPGIGTPIVPGDDGIGRYFTLGMRFKY